MTSLSFLQNHSRRKCRFHNNGMKTWSRKLPHGSVNMFANVLPMLSNFFPSNQGRTQGGDEGDTSPTRPKEVLTWHVTLSKEFVAVHVWNAPNYWHNWLVAGVKTAPPAKLNVKTGPLLACIFVVTILLVSVDCCFSEHFPVFSFFL